MAGAEGQSRLDLQPDVIGFDPVAVMRAMNQETPGAHGGKALQRGGDPVLLLDPAEFYLLRQILADRDRDQGADIFLVRLAAEIDFHHPGRGGPARGRGFLLEGGGGGFGGVESLDHQIGDGARPILVAAQAHDESGVVGGQSFEHAPRYHGAEGKSTRCFFAVDMKASRTHKPANEGPRRTGLFRRRKANFRRGRVSRAAKGGDCKSPGYAFVGSSPTSPTKKSYIIVLNQYVAGGRDKPGLAPSFFMVCSEPKRRRRFPGRGRPIMARPGPTATGG